MREQLQKIDGARATFRATFKRFGSKTALKGPPIVTLLFVDVVDLHGRQMCDHIWFTMTKGFEALKLMGGELVQFDGRVREYEKGYKGRRDDDFDDCAPISTDYKLSHPTNIRLVNAAKPLTDQELLEQLPLFAHA